MNTLAESDVENAKRREDILRELNLYPLWQLRHPSVVADSAADVAETPATTDTTELPVSLTDDLETSKNDIASFTWTALKKRVKSCVACDLRAGCMQTIFGAGDENADWLFVGSWPTEDDEAKGEPFAGQAGQLLDNMLATIKLKRGVNVYLTNIVKCNGSITRGPQADQIAQCAPYLTRQIELIKPKIIIALGHAAATVLLGEDRSWNSLLGKIHGFVGFSKDSSELVIPLIVTHHPAALLLSPLNKAQTWQDLCLARDTMKETGFHS